MRVLVTGAGGFVGRHLVSELLQRGHTVFAGTLRGDAAFPTGVETLRLDVLDKDGLCTALKVLSPEGIVHLAAQSMVTVSWQDPRRTFAVNVLGTVNLLEAVHTELPDCKVVSVGSGEEYGLSAVTGVPLTEEHPCQPMNPYATSKLAMGLIALQLARRHDLRVIHVRPFNHFGPGQPEGFVVSDFAAQVARIEAGLQPPVIRVGDCSAKRDFLDVRDVVRAYAEMLVEDLPNGIYNVCSGIARRVQDILDALLREASVSIDVTVDAARLRRSEVPTFVGSAEKLMRLTNWRPQRDFCASLKETLDWWREAVGGKRC